MNLPFRIADDLLLRQAVPQDAEALAAFNAQIHSDNGPDDPDSRIRVWVEDLFRKPHPTFTLGEFTVVEDTRTGRIVSSLNTFHQTWAFEGLPFPVGRPELVGTLKEYRRRGLVRLQMDVVHEWGAARGELMQVITGIPNYYRQFGYEMALEISGGRMGYRPHVPELKSGEVEAYNFRPAVEADIPFLMEAYAHTCAGHLISCVRDASLWRYELTGRSPANQVRLEIVIIQDLAGLPVGYLAHPTQLWGPAFPVLYLDLLPGQPWIDAAPAIVRFMRRVGQGYAAQTGQDWEAFYFCLGADHPIYHVLHDRLPRTRQPYAWYVRLPDLPAFLQKIGPALQNRLAASPAAGFSGALRLDFYRSGAALHFTAGKLTAVEPFLPAAGGRGDVCFPDTTFYQLLFGRKTLQELENFLVDCYVNDERLRVVIESLFPAPRLSNVWGVV